MRILLEHDYPGNVRELENAIEHAAVLCRSALIQARDLPPHLRSRATSERAPGQRTARGTTTGLRDLELLSIVDSLRRNHGNRTVAARALGIDPSTLYRRLKAAGVPLPPVTRKRT
jgi:DNA-binding NtrC family response regulator